MGLMTLRKYALGAMGYNVTLHERIGTTGQAPPSKNALGTNGDKTTQQVQNQPETYVETRLPLPKPALSKISQLASPTVPAYLNPPGPKLASPMVPGHPNPPSNT